MLKPNVKNEIIKRKFFRWLKEADQCCEATVNNVEKAILLYQDFTKNADFAIFSPDRAIQYKQWLVQRQSRGRPMALATYHAYLRFLRKFFGWLAWQPGYKTRITPDKVDYLKISEKEERMATQTSPRSYPSLEYVQKLAGSIPTATEIDLRDRALVAFTLLSGMRDRAIVTLPLGCFDPETLLINQSPLSGVETKFSKHILTTLLPLDAELLSYVRTWVTNLKKRGFGSAEPLFPRARADQGDDNLSFVSAVEVEPVFWANAGRMREIFKKRAGDAGLPYHPPHTFRHLAVNLALKSCRTGEEIKAVSQNFGHEYVATTFAAYGNYQPDRLAEVIRGLDRSRTGGEDGDAEAIRAAIEAFTRRKNGVL